MRPRSVRDADVSGKRALVRADLNVPLEDGRVADDTRIRASLPTLELLLGRGAAEIVVCSHLGRPEGKDPAFSMRPVEERLREVLPDERIRVLENTRFNSGETENAQDFARELADELDLYVNDAFGSAHRAHASTVGVAQILPAYAGLLLEQELEQLGKLLGDVERPFVLISGGAKVDDKLGVLRNLGGRADEVLIGGKMAEQLRDGNPLGFEVRLPTDVVAASEFSNDAEAKVVPYDELPDGWLGLDIGPETREAFAARVAEAKTVFWNGPMGVFEWSRFAEGTKAVAEAVAEVDGYTVVGGADSIRALTELQLVDHVDWASTGGGAALRAPGREGIARRRQQSRRRKMLIAGNWKMFKSPAETAEFCIELKRQLPSSRASTSPFARRSPRWRSRFRSWPGRTSRSQPKTCTGSSRALSQARSRRRCCASSGSTAPSSATRSAASSSGRPTRRPRSARGPPSTPDCR